MEAKTEKLKIELINWYKNNKRWFPWRNTSNPWKILLIEILSQQTQLERANTYYKKFIKEFEEKYRIKIIEAEEDFTSQAVADKKENEDFDSKSAELIFEGWYNQNYG